MKVHVSYVSSGVNQTPRCINWCRDTVAYAADTGILLYNPQISNVVGASPKIHKNTITSVRWIQPGPSTGQTLISTGADALALVWTVSKDEVEGLRTLQCIATLEHNEGVFMSDGIVVYEDEKEKLFIVTAISDEISCWIVCPVTGEKECRKTFSIPNHSFITSLILMKVEEAKYPLLLCGGHDSRIHIFSCDDLGDYSLQAVLNGHEDWVTSLDVMREDNGGLLLASGSKDSSVRVWRFSVQKDAEASEDENKKSKVLRLRSVVMRVRPSSGDKDITISVLLDSLLAGHEGLISEVCWARSVVQDGIQHQPYRLLSCSKTLDRAIIIWEPEEGADKGGGIWVEVARLGEVGGNMEGYFACQFSPDSARVLGCSYQGALHMWENQNGSWEPCVVVGGHFKEVTDLAWDPQGRYLLSTSKDQTTRLHAPWRKSDETAWHEIGRPQVHGYDMACICSLGPFKFASGAEEKVIRGFSAPANSIRNFGQITGDTVKEDIDRCDVGEGASVPSLGLSNKSVMMSDLEEGQQIREEGREEVQAYFKPVSLTSPPTEDQLMQNTLWPEAAKLYGHGHDIIALAATSDGSILASSCRAAQEVDANIILWDVKKWQQADVLLKHRLTVTQMEFSSDDNYLLSVSRDRTWAIFKREPSENNAGITYKLSDSSKKKETMHARVIWSCAWLPDSKHFVTASRDKTVSVWGLGDDEGWTRISILNETDEVTAVAATVFESSEGNSQCLIATGLVNGVIKIRCYSIEESSFSTEVVQISHQHHRTVKRLKFKPSAQTCPVLASCGEDNRVQIYEISL